MKYILKILSIISLLVNFSFAGENQIKHRSIQNNKEFKEIQININPDLLNIKEIEKLNFKYRSVKNFIKEIDKEIKPKQNIKFRGSSKNIYDKYARSVFFLINEKKTTLGTGFLIDKEGLILTNWHVTEGAKELLVWTLPKSGVVTPKIMFKKITPFYGQLIAENKTQDLALIKVTGLPDEIEPVKLSSMEKVDIGDTVYAIGHPKQLPWTFSFGMVSQIRKDYQWQYSENSKHEATVIQMQTPISTGNSGGPLFNEIGEVVGVNTLMQGEGENLNFAVAVNHAKKFIKENPYIKKINTAGKLVKKKFPNAREQDYNKNGIIDTWYVDFDQNGEIDRAYIDDDEDGFVEGILIDKNENSIWEIFLEDTDKSGKSDKAYIDEDEDKKTDLIAYDYDEDGKWDKFETQNNS